MSVGAKGPSYDYLCISTCEGIPFADSFNILNMGEYPWAVSGRT